MARIVLGILLLDDMVRRVDGRTRDFEVDSLMRCDETVRISRGVKAIHTVLDPSPLQLTFQNSVRRMPSYLHRDVPE